MASKIGEFFGKVWDEFERPVNQGRAEAAHGLYAGNNFYVAYGDSQRPGKAPHENANEGEHQQMESSIQAKEGNHATHEAQPEIEMER